MFKNLEKFSNEGAGFTFDSLTFCCGAEVVPFDGFQVFRPLLARLP